MKWALLGGALGAGAVLAFLVPRKVREFEARAQAMQSDLETAEGAAQIRALQARLAEYAEVKAEGMARQEGDRYMEDVYGLSAERIRRLEAYARSLG